MSNRITNGLAVMGLIAANLVVAVGLVVMIAPIGPGALWRARLEIANATCMAQFTLLGLWLAFGQGSALLRLGIVILVAGLLVSAIRLGLVLGAFSTGTSVLGLVAALGLPAAMVCLLLAPLRRLGGWRLVRGPPGEQRASLRFEISDLIAYTALIGLTLGTVHALREGKVLEHLAMSAKDVVAVLPILIPTVLVVLAPRWRWWTMILLAAWVAALTCFETSLKLLLVWSMTGTAAFPFGILGDFLICGCYNAATLLAIASNLMAARTMGIRLARPSPINVAVAEATDRNFRSAAALFSSAAESARRSRARCLAESAASSRQAPERADPDPE